MAGRDSICKGGKIMMRTVRYFATSHVRNDDDGKAMPNVRLAGTKCIGHETLTVSSNAEGLANIPVEATAAMISVEGADIRYWLDGSDPTNTEGHLAYKDDIIKLDSADQLRNFRVIAVSGSATLQVSYF